MTMIDEILAKQDAAELIRDQIAAILALEAGAASTLPIRVFAERSNPWAEWVDAPVQDDQVPVVNVSWDSANYDAKASSAVSGTRAIGTFHIDCYGYGISEETAVGGHIPGDARAALEAHKAARIVRNILMAGQYTYLGMRGVVGRRFVQSITVFQPQLGGQAVQNIVGVRVALEVHFEESSPQVAGQPLERVTVAVKRAETGEVLLTAAFGT